MQGSANLLASPTPPTITDESQICGIETCSLIPRVRNPPQQLDALIMFPDRVPYVLFYMVPNEPGKNSEEAARFIEQNGDHMSYKAMTYWKAENCESVITAPKIVMSNTIGPESTSSKQ